MYIMNRGRIMAIDIVLWTVEIKVEGINSTYRYSFYASNDGRIAESIVNEGMSRDFPNYRYSIIRLEKEEQ